MWGPVEVVEAPASLSECCRRRHPVIEGVMTVRTVRTMTIRRLGSLRPAPNRARKMPSTESHSLGFGGIV